MIALLVASFLCRAVSISPERFFRSEVDSHGVASAASVLPERIVDFEAPGSMSEIQLGQSSLRDHDVMQSRTIAVVEPGTPLDFGNGAKFQIDSAIPVFFASGANSTETGYIAFLVGAQDDYLSTRVNAAKITCSDAQGSFKTPLEVYGGESDLAYKWVLALRCPWPVKAAADSDCHEVVLAQTADHTEVAAQYFPPVSYKVCHRPELAKTPENFNTALCVSEPGHNDKAKPAESAALNMPQWLEFNVMSGVDQMVFYTLPDSPQWYLDVIMPYVESGLAMRVDFNTTALTNPYRQTLFANDCLYRMKTRARWLLPTIDFDEYLRIKLPSDSSDSSDPGAVKYEFDKLLASLDERPQEVFGFLLDRYTFRQPENLTLLKVSSEFREEGVATTSPKYVVRPAFVNALFVHWPTSWEKGMRMIRTQPDKLVLNHYRTLDAATTTVRDASLVSLERDLDSSLEQRYKKNWATFLQESNDETQGSASSLLQIESQTREQKQLTVTRSAVMKALESLTGA